MIFKLAAFNERKEKALPIGITHENDNKAYKENYDCGSVIFPGSIKFKSVYAK